MENGKAKSQLSLEAFCDKKISPQKVLSLNGRLRLKKNYSQSFSQNTEDSNTPLEPTKSSVTRQGSSNLSNKVDCPISPIPERDDSLAEFKSPVEKPESKTVLRNFKLIVEKPKKKLSSKYKQSTSKEDKSNGNRKSSNIHKAPTADETQTKLESSFFKPHSEVKTALVCPLCFKTLKDDAAHKVHMKSCAAQKNVPTRKLLDAVELQERQAEERKAMGLLPAPVLQPKKPVFRKKIADKDTQLAIGIALSESLHQARQVEELEMAALLVGDNQPLREELLEERRKTLQGFGFTTNKPMVAPVSSGSRRKKPLGPTLLQTRSQDERDRLVTEKIAEILMGDESVTQAMERESETTSSHRMEIVIRSSLLQGYHCSEDRLWDKSKLTPSRTNFYVTDLSEVISPRKMKQDQGVRQLPQETNSPNPRNHVKSDSPDKCAVSTTNISDKHGNTLLEKNGKVERDSEKGKTASLRSSIDINEVNKIDVYENVGRTLVSDWGMMLNLSSMSDILVFVRGDTHIYAHKLVFFVRCSDIMIDIVPNDNEQFQKIKEKICWPTTDYFSAMAFLEFIYSGVIERNLYIFDNSDFMTGVRVLARKYRVKELFAYLREAKKKQNEQARNGREQVKCDIEMSNSTNEASTSRQSSIETPKIRHCSGHNSLERSRSSKRQFDIDPQEEEGNTRKILHSSLIPTTVNRTEQVRNSPTKKTPNIRKSSDFGEEVESRRTESPNNCSSQVGQSTSQSSTKTARSISETIGENDVFGLQTSEVFCTQDISAFVDATANRSSLDNILTSTKMFCNRVSSDSEKISTLNNCEEVEHCIEEDGKLVNENNLLLVGESSERQGSVSPDIFADSEEEASVVVKSNDGTQNLEILLSLVNKASQLESSSTQSTEIQSEKSNEPSFLEQEVIPKRFENITLRRRKPAPTAWKTDSSEEETQTNSQKTDAKICPEKQKSDISLAIEKIKKLNAKSMSDSDSEVESPQRFPTKRHKNPFNLNRKNSSSFFCEPSKNTTDSSAGDEIPQRKRNALSIFEMDIQKEAAKNPAAFNLTSYKHAEDVASKTSSSFSNALMSTGSDDVFEESKLDAPQEEIDAIGLSQDRHVLEDVVFDLTHTSSDEASKDKSDTNVEDSVDDRDKSMYSKYIKDHSCNSISKYRFALRNALQSNAGSDEQLQVDGAENTNDESSDESVSEHSNAGTEKSEDCGKSWIERNDEVDGQLKAIGSGTELSMSDIDVDMSSASTIVLPQRTDNLNETTNTGSTKSPTDTSLDKAMALKEIDSLVSLDLSDTEFTMMKTQKDSTMLNQTSKSFDVRYLSDAETDTDCYIEMISHASTSKESGSEKRSFGVINNAGSRVYENEIDTECGRAYQELNTDRFFRDNQKSGTFKTEIKNKDTSRENNLTSSNSPDELDELAQDELEVTRKIKSGSRSNSRSNISSEVMKDEIKKKDENVLEVGESEMRELDTNNAISVLDTISIGSSPEPNSDYYEHTSYSENHYYSPVRLNDTNLYMNNLSSTNLDFRSANLSQIRDFAATPKSIQAERASQIRSKDVDSTSKAKSDNCVYELDSRDEKFTVEVSKSPEKLLKKKSLDCLENRSSIENNSADCNKYNGKKKIAGRSRRQKYSGTEEESRPKSTQAKKALQSETTEVNNTSRGKSDNYVYTLDSRNEKVANETSKHPETSIRKKSRDSLEKRSSIEDKLPDYGYNENNKISSHSRRQKNGSTLQESGLKSSVKSLKVKSASESVLRPTSSQKRNILDDSSDEELLTKTPARRIPSLSGVHNHHVTPPQKIIIDDVTPPANYSAMTSPQLKKELQKYGLKAQKRPRAKQLLRYIYDSLHPLVAVENTNACSSSTTSKSDNEEPPTKRINRSESPEMINVKRRSEEDSESDSNKSVSQSSTVSDGSDGSVIAEEMEFDEPDIANQIQNSTSLEEAFRKMMDADKELHRKVLTYEPLKLEEVHAILKARGFKCKLNALMDFLDEQCITFRSHAQGNRNRTRRKRSPKKNQADEGPARSRKK